MKIMTKRRFFRDSLKEHMKNPKFKKAFDEYDMPVRLAMAITAARQKAGFTQKELADKIGSTQPAVARLEAGDVINPEFQTIIKIEHALHPHFWFSIGRARNLAA